MASDRFESRRFREQILGYEADRVLACLCDGKPQTRLSCPKWHETKDAAPIGKTSPEVRT